MQALAIPRERSTSVFPERTIVLRDTVGRIRVRQTTAPVQGHRATEFYRVRRKAVDSSGILWLLRTPWLAVRNGRRDVTRCADHGQLLKCDGRRDNFGAVHWGFFHFSFTSVFTGECNCFFPFPDNGLRTEFGVYNLANGCTGSNWCFLESLVTDDVFCERA